MNFRTRLILMFLALTLACLAGVGLYQGLHPTPPQQPLALRTDREEGTPLLGGPFSLYDQEGKRCTNEDFLGKWMLIYFGYTFCPDICPMGLAAMSDALLRVDPACRVIQPIFITIDPERDSVENLKLYSSTFNPHFKMLTGSLQEIQQVMKHYRVYGARVNPTETSDYLMDHSSLIYLMDPQGTYVAHFNHKTPPAEMASKLRSICGL